MAAEGAELRPIGRAFLVNEVIRLHRGWSYVPSAEGIDFTHLVSGRRLRVTCNPTSLARALRLLDQGLLDQTASFWVSRAAALTHREACLLLDKLVLHGIAIRTEQYDDLYARQRDFFDLFERPGLDGTVLHERLAASRVLIVGLGGYGSLVALLAARMGIRDIVGVDPDRVALSNLNRQLLYTRNDLGRLKVEVAAERCREADSDVSFKAVDRWIGSTDELLPYLDGVNLVFNSFGYHRNPSLDLVAEACLRNGTPSLLLGGSWIGPLTIPGQTACYGCLLASPLLREVARASQADYMPDADDMITRRSSSQFAPRVAATAAIGVWEAARFLSGCDTPPTIDGIVTLDLFSYRGPVLHTLARDPSCASCATVALAS